MSGPGKFLLHCKQQESTDPAEGIWKAIHITGPSPELRSMVVGLMVVVVVVVLMDCNHLIHHLDFCLFWGPF